MKIAILFNKATEETARSIGKIVAARSCKLVYVDTGTVWDKDLCKNPVTILEGVSHLLYVSVAAPADLNTLIFFAGYALGRGIRLVMIEKSGTLPIPENSRHLGIVLKPEQFEEYLDAEQVRFSTEEKKKRARNQLLERGISCFDENFILIVSSGDTESVGLFLEAGFDPELTDQKGIPALSLAVRAQMCDVAGLLIDAGADVNRLSGDRGYSPLMDAAQKGDSRMVSFLLARGADPNLRSKDGQTALVICAGRGDADMAELLVAHGADPSISDNLGMSAASYAKLFKNGRMMELFNTPRA